MNARYSPAQSEALADAVRAGRTPACPACDAQMDVHDVPPRADVSYVRDRLWLTCPRCHRSAVLDRREGA